jgi:hypothetical protein
MAHRPFAPFTVNLENIHGAIGVSVFLHQFREQNGVVKDPRLKR